jgi:signal transduction histidine kinase
VSLDAHLGERERAVAGRERAIAEERRAVAEQLKAAERVKSQLLAVVSHEFRTPLASIAGLARTLQARLDDLDEDAVQACLTGIDHHARRLTGLVHNIVAASGEVMVDHAAVTEIGEIAIDVLAAALDAHQASARVRLDLPPRLEAMIGARAARQILANVCDNAVKFSPPDGCVEIAGSSMGKEVVVEIANDTTELCETLLDKCFEPFVQADSSDTREVDGLGLGLHVARRIARAHGGDLDAQLCGERVVFRLRVPAPPVPHGGADRLELVRGDADAVVL